MNKIATIGGLLKKIYRIYSSELIKNLGNRGYQDLRPSFLEVLVAICESQAIPSIKQIAGTLGLKKQTMTGHLNELEKRNYIVRKVNPLDGREQHIYLTNHGEKFKLNLIEAAQDLEKFYISVIGVVELDRAENVLANFHSKISKH